MLIHSRAGRIFLIIVANNAKFVRNVFIEIIGVDTNRPRNRSMWHPLR